MRDLGMRALAASAQGGFHREHGMESQDFSAVYAGEGWLCAAVADGHGSRKYFRSGTGAELACDALRETLERLGADAEPQALKDAIVARWRERVRAHLAAQPFTQEELAEQEALLSAGTYASLVRGETAEIAYGSTLVCAVVTQAGWLAMQLGDGGVALFDAAGGCAFPMPESAANVGFFTASLAMADPAGEFRHCAGAGRPALLTLYTDGVEKAFPEKSLALAQYLHAAYTGALADEQALAACVTRIAESSAVRDDTSLALLLDEGVAVAPPAQTDGQREAALRRLRAQLAECEGTLDYLLRLMEGLDPQGEEATRISGMIARKWDELSRLTRAIEDGGCT